MSWFHTAQVGDLLSTLNRIIENHERKPFVQAKDSTVTLLLNGILTWMYNHDDQVIKPTLNIDSSDSEEVCNNYT